MELTFLGATQTVTGSRCLLQHGKAKILIDCGLFQGFKNLRLRNWEPFPIEPSSIDAVLLTHAHLDHSGYLPLLVKNGFRGPVYATAGTKDLCRILLPDSGYLQEEEARYANRRGFSKHRPALPLYTQADAEKSIHSIREVDWGKQISIGSDLVCEFHRAGHLVGAASIWISAGNKTVGFSGDLGRSNDPMVLPPKFGRAADTIILESTYGGRAHPLNDPMLELKEVINRTHARGGTVLIPSFAVGRAQLVLYYIYRLKKLKAIPDIPVYLNSPMASHANEVMRRLSSECKLDSSEIEEVCRSAEVVTSPEMSMALNERLEPKIIVAASGMATGGRVLHHLKIIAPNPKNSIVFVGFQAGGTRGEAMVNGAKEVKIHGAYWPIHAEVVHMDSMSAHADQAELLAWVRALPHPPKQILINHGEIQAADVLRRTVQDSLGIATAVPEFLQTISL